MSNELEQQLLKLMKYIAFLSDLQSRKTEIEYRYEKNNPDLPPLRQQIDMLSLLSDRGAIVFGEEMCERMNPEDPNDRPVSGIKIDIGKNFHKLMQSYSGQASEEQTLTLLMSDNRLLISLGEQSKVIRTFQDGKSSYNLFRYIFNGHLNEPITLAMILNDGIKVQGLTNFSQFIHNLKLTEILAPFTEKIGKSTLQLNNQASLNELSMKEYVALLDKFREK